MNFIEVKFYNWENSQKFDPGSLELKPGDWAVVEVEKGHEIGKVVDLGQIEESELEAPLKKVLRVAELEDLEKFKKQQESRSDALKICKQLVRKYDLPMKLVDCNFSFDESKVTFAFTSDTRVDFRELVKDLVKHFGKNVRLQQIGIRDELKQSGGIGPCGRKLCCSTFLDDLGNITTDLARLQHIEHRGSERLSGVCGRLKCCLNYEALGYREMSEKMPQLGSTYKSKEHGQGKVIGWHILRHSLKLRIDKDTVVEEFLGCRKAGCSGCGKCKNKEK